MSEDLALIRRCQLAVETNEPMSLEDRQAFVRLHDESRAVAQQEAGDGQ